MEISAKINVEPNTIFEENNPFELHVTRGGQVQRLKMTRAAAARLWLELDALLDSTDEIQ